MFELPLPGVHIWRLRVRFTHPEPPLDWAARVHSRLGPALHDRACALACGAGRCRLGSGCGFFRCYDTEGTRSFRFDCSELDHQPMDVDDQRSLRLVTYRSYDEGVLLASLPEALAPHTLSAPVRLSHGGDAPAALAADEGLDLGPRATRLAQRVEVELRALTALKRGGRLIEEPGVLDVLHATRHRGRALGLDLSAWPPFEDDVSLVESAGAVAGVRLHPSTRRPEGGLPPRHRGPVAIPGVAARWHVVPTAAQAAWLALAEVTGVGGKTALGMGVVRAREFLEPR